MNKMICARCGKSPAVVFISKIQGEETSQEGLCLKCAMDMNIGPIKQIMENMGITEEDIDSVSEQLGDVFGAMNGEEGDFQPGGTGTFPTFLQGLFNNASDSMPNGAVFPTGDDSDSSAAPADTPAKKRPEKDKKRHSTKQQEKQRKFIGLYRPYQKG